MYILFTISVLFLTISATISTKPKFLDPSITKIHIHPSHIHKLGAINPITNTVTFLSVSSSKKQQTTSTNTITTHSQHKRLLTSTRVAKTKKGFFSKKKKKKVEIDTTDLSTKDGKDFNQKQINELTEKVEESRHKVSAIVVEHTKLEETLHKALTSGGKFQEPQKQNWHGKVYTYTPKHDKWLTLPYWNGQACAIGVVTGPGGHCHRDLKSTIGTCSAKPDEKILATLGLYSSKSCECSMCSGYSGEVFAAPYCHTRGIPNSCRCMLVDNKIENEEDCLDVQ